MVPHREIFWKAKEKYRSKQMTGYLLWTMDNVYYVYAFLPQSKKTTNNTAVLKSI
jgi:hypothetical protein